MEILLKGTVSTEFWKNRPKLWGNCAFPQNLHTRTLCKTTTFYAVSRQIFTLTIIPTGSKRTWAIVLYVSIRFYNINLITFSRSKKWIIFTVYFRNGKTTCIILHFVDWFFGITIIHRFTISAPFRSLHGFY